MGVRGLTTYIEYNQDGCLKKHLLHDSNLVIDGHSLCAQLYGCSKYFSAFGGDYDKYAASVKSFFKNLQKCNVTPYVIFDGSYEPKKLKTAYSRLRSRISGASRLDPVTQNRLQIFPLLLRDVFKEVLLELNIAFTVCEFEADNDIAAMARFLNCPVLSFDSDFFIFNVLYIPFKTLELKPVRVELNDKKVFAIHCKIYLAEGFNGVHKDLLPLLATLLGNDYVEKRVFRKFFSQLKLPKGRKMLNVQQRSIHALFKWLQNETLDTAVSKILGRLKKHQKGKVYAIIKCSIKSYNNNYCSSLQYFNITNQGMALTSQDSANIHLEESLSDGDEETDTSDDSSSYSSDDDNEPSLETCSVENDFKLKVPNWFVNGVRNNTIPSQYLELYTLHLYFCSPQAEDYSDDDPFLCTMPIIRYAFDILTDFSVEHFTYVCREKDCNYKRILIGQEFAISRLVETPFCDLTKDQLIEYFQNILDVKLSNLDMSLLKLLPSNFQLLCLSMLWWLKYCKVTSALVHGIFICYVMLEVIDEKTGMFRGSHHFNNKYSKKLEEIRKRSTGNIENNDEVFLNKNKVVYDDCLLAASVLLNHFEIDASIRKKPKSYDIKNIHSLAQFQSCLMQLNSLNTLCGSPFQSTQYSKCYNGTFVYNVALKLDGETDPNTFIHQYLKGASTVLIFYNSLCVIFSKLKDNLCLTEGPVKKKRSKRRKKISKDEEINFIVKGFDSEVII